MQEKSSHTEMEEDSQVDDHEAGEDSQDIIIEDYDEDDVKNAVVEMGRKGGINKLFDLMKTDLGEHQMGEMKNFYEKMSTQIKELCTSGDDAAALGVKDETNTDREQQSLEEAKEPKKESQSQLNSVFMLQLLQYQKQKILQESAGPTNHPTKTVANQGREQSQNMREEDASQGESSDEKIVFDERPGEPCLVDEEESSSTNNLPLTKEKATFQKMRIKCLLRPHSEATSQFLLEKSSNNINPYVVVEAEARTRVSTLIAHMSTKLFKEEPKRFELRVHQTKFSNRKCLGKRLRIQDLLLAEDSEKLEAALEGDKAIRLVVRYAICDTNGDKSQCDSSSSEGEENEAPVEVPEDLSEAELMEMLTEVMSIMLFNKDEKLNKYAGQMGEFDLKAKLQHPNDLLGKRNKRKKKPSEIQGHQQPGQQQLQQSLKDNEKSELSHTSQQQRRREAKLQLKQANKNRSVSERLSDYQKTQREKFEKTRQQREQQVQKFVMRKYNQMRERCENWQFNGAAGRENGHQQGFTSVEELINFRTNPYYDNLVRFGNGFMHR